VSADRTAELLAEGREAWPGITCDEQEFRRRIGQMASAGADTRYATDLYLACACAAGDDVALLRFEQEVLSGIDVALRKIDPSPAFADEVRQLLRNRLLVADIEHGQPARIASYAGRGPLITWVRVAAVRAALTLIEKQRREVPATLSRIDALAPADVDPGIAYLKRRYAAEFEAAFRDACKGLSPRARTVLRLNFGDGLNIEQIGSVYGVHRATVARWIARAREQLLDRTRAALERRLKLSPEEFDSMVKLVRSQIDISISQFFATAED